MEACRQLLTDVSPEVKETLSRFHIQNYSIYLKELRPGEPYLFASFEYTGNDYEADRAKMRQHRQLQQWQQSVWAECLEKVAPNTNSWWIDMEEVFFFAGRDDLKIQDSEVQRYASVIGVRPEMVEGYKQLHVHPWQGVLDKLREGNLRNYPIYLTTLGENVYIFGYFEYVGADFGADMKMVDSDPVTIAWMKFTDQACQLPLDTRKEGEWWATMEPLFCLP